MIDPKDTPIQPAALPTIGKKIKIVAVLIKDDLTEFQKLLDADWKISYEAKHPDGALILMAKE